MWQVLIVAAIVLAATLYTAWALMPTTWRLRATRRIARWTAGADRPAMVARLAAALESASRLRPCGCGDCGASKTVSRSTSSAPSVRGRADD